MDPIPPRPPSFQQQQSQLPNQLNQMNINGAPPPGVNSQQRPPAGANYPPPLMQRPLAPGQPVFSRPPPPQFAHQNMPNMQQPSQPPNMGFPQRPTIQNTQVPHGFPPSANAGASSFQPQQQMPVNPAMRPMAPPSNMPPRPMIPSTSGPTMRPPPQAGGMAQPMPSLPLPPVGMQQRPMAPSMMANRPNIPLPGPPPMRPPMPSMNGNPPPPFPNSGPNMSPSSSQYLQPQRTGSFSSSSSQLGVRPDSMGGSKTKIDPSQIPSAVQVVEQDCESFANVPYVTSSHLVPPIIASRVPIIDDGNASPLFVRSTLYNIPTTGELLNSTGIPFALIVQPFAKTAQPLSAVDVRETGPIRCNRCQGYINAFCRFVEGGKSFVCNLCQGVNEVSNEFFCNLDFSGKRADIDSRPELKYGSVDFIVSKEYILHPLSRPSVVFAIDCSTAAQRSGAFSQCLDSIKECLNTPEFTDLYEKIGILTFDKTIQFYDLRESLNQPQVIVVSDIDDPFVPLERGFFCDIKKSRNLILALLKQLPSLYLNSAIAGSVLGSAVKVATAALKENGGGRLILMQSVLPDHGMGILQNRENPSFSGTEKEIALFNSNGDFYKNMAEECCTNGVCVSIFAMSSGYVDSSTVGFLATWTGGDYYLYSQFSTEKHGFRLVRDVCSSLSKPFVFDVLGRVRTSNMLKVSQYFGNLGMRNALDMEFGALDCSHAIAISFEHDGKLEEKELAYFQIALLHTTSNGERRVRVHNFSLPVTSLVANVYRYSSLEGSVNFLSKQSASQALSVPIKDIKAALQKRVTRTLATYRKTCASSVAPGQLILPDPFKLLPLFLLSMMKSKPFQSNISPDERLVYFHALRTMSVEESRIWYYPNLFALHMLLDEPDNAQKPPSPMRLLFSSLDSQGIFLLENGVYAYIWIGNSVLPQLLNQLFNVSDLAAVNVHATELPPLNNKLSVKTRNLLGFLRSQRDDYVGLKIIRQGADPAESEFMGLFVEEQNAGHPSHVDFLCQIHSEIQQQYERK